MPKHQWHRAEIKFHWIRLWNCLCRYGYFVWSDLTDGLKKPKIDPEFLEKLEYWRTNKSLTVITDDTVDAFRSMADGRMYTSKKKYRQELKGRGFDEVGNDTGEETEKSRKYWEDQEYDKKLKKDVAEALYGR